MIANNKEIIAVELKQNDDYYSITRCALAIKTSLNETTKVLLKLVNTKNKEEAEKYKNIINTAYSGMLLVKLKRVKEQYYMLLGDKYAVCVLVNAHKYYGIFGANKLCIEQNYVNHLFISAGNHTPKILHVNKTNIF